MGAPLPGCVALRLVALLLTLTLRDLAEGCSCNPAHPQQHFCSAEIGTSTSDPHAHHTRPAAFACCAHDIHPHIGCFCRGMGTSLFAVRLCEFCTVGKDGLWILYCGFDGVPDIAGDPMQDWVWGRVGGFQFQT